MKQGCQAVLADLNCYCTLLRFEHSQGVVGIWYINDPCPSTEKRMRVSSWINIINPH